MIFVNGSGRTVIDAQGTLLDKLTEAATRALECLGEGAASCDPIDAIIVSYQIQPPPGLHGAIQGAADTRGLIGVQLRDRLAQDLRFRHLLDCCEVYRVETASNSLSTVALAGRLLRSGHGRRVLVVGGEIMRSASERFDDANRDAIDSMIGEEVRRITYLTSRGDALRPGQNTVISAITGLALFRHGMSFDHLAELKAWFSGREEVAKNALVEDGRQVSYRRFPEPRAGATRNTRDQKGDGGAAKGEPAEIKYKTEQEFREAYKSPRNGAWTSALQQMDFCSVCNGAGALLLSNHRDDRAEVRAIVRGVGIGADDSLISARTLPYALRATRLALLRACVGKGISRKPIDPGALSDLFKNGKLIVETHVPFAPLALLHLIDLQLMRDKNEIEGLMNGTWPEAVPEPTQGPRDEIEPARVGLNPSGGLRDGHPIGGTSLIKLHECIKRLGKGADLALCHSVGGPGTSVGVVLVSSPDKPAVHGIDVSADHMLDLGLDRIRAEEKDWQDRLQELLKTRNVKANQAVLLALVWSRRDKLAGWTEAKKSLDEDTAREEGSKDEYVGLLVMQRPGEPPRLCWGRPYSGDPAPTRADAERVRQLSPRVSVHEDPEKNVWFHQITYPGASAQPR